MSTITIDIPSETYEKLAEQARKAGKGPEDLGRELLEAALQSLDKPDSTRAILKAMGRTRPLGDSLRAKIISGITLDEVRKSLSETAGPSLSELISAQRGPKS